MFDRRSRDPGRRHRRDHRGARIRPPDHPEAAERDRLQRPDVSGDQPVPPDRVPRLCRWLRVGAVGIAVHRRVRVQEPEAVGRGFHDQPRLAGKAADDRGVWHQGHGRLGAAAHVARRAPVRQGGRTQAHAARGVQAGSVSWPSRHRRAAEHRSLSRRPDHGRGPVAPVGGAAEPGRADGAPAAVRPAERGDLLHRLCADPVFRPGSGLRGEHLSVWPGTGGAHHRRLDQLRVSAVDQQVAERLRAVGDLPGAARLSGPGHDLQRSPLLSHRRARRRRHHRCVRPERRRLHDHVRRSPARQRPGLAQPAALHAHFPHLGRRRPSGSAPAAPWSNPCCRRRRSATPVTRSITSIDRCWHRRPTGPAGSLARAA